MNYRPIIIIINTVTSNENSEQLYFMHQFQKQPVLTRNKVSSHVFHIPATRDNLRQLYTVISIC